MSLSSQLRESLAALLHLCEWLSQSLLLWCRKFLQQPQTPTADGLATRQSSKSAAAAVAAAAAVPPSPAAVRAIVDDGSGGGGSALTSLVLQLPPDIRAEPACFLDLKTFAALATVERAAFQHLWDSPATWQVLALYHGVPRPLAAAVPAAASDAGGVALCSAFRRAMFRLDGERLRSRSGRKDHLATLEEAAHMVAGLMPCDGPAIVEELCSAVERALNSFDPACTRSVKAAEAFFDSAFRSIDLIGEPLFERMEHAFRSAQNIHELMTSSMRAHLTHSMLDFQESFWMESFDFPSLEESSLVDTERFWSDSAWEMGRLTSEAKE